MKRSFTLTISLALLLAPAGPLLAQSGVTLGGVQGGATVGDFYNFEDGVGFFSNTRWGGTAGLFAGRTFGRSAQANLEVNWVQMGGADTRVDYIDIPLTLGGGLLGTGGGVIARGYVGISFGFKVACSAPQGVVDPCNSAKDTQWTLPVGLLFGKWMESGVFVGMDIRFLWGLSDVFEASEARNRSLQFRLVLGRQLGARR
jgi:hypothetical protein